MDDRNARITTRITELRLDHVGWAYDRPWIAVEVHSWNSLNSRNPVQSVGCPFRVTCLFGGTWVKDKPHSSNVLNVSGEFAKAALTMLGHNSRIKLIQVGNYT